MCLALPAAAQASDAVHSCRTPLEQLGTRNDPQMNISDMSTRNMSCRQAKDAVALGWLWPNGGIMTPGFHCRRLRTYRSHGTVRGATIRWTSRSWAFRFTWAA